MPLNVRLRRAVGRFFRETTGAASLELMIWIPLVFGIFVTILDFAHAFTLNSSMWHEARVVARGMSMHELSDAKARQVIRENLAWSRSDYVIEIEEDRRSVYVTIRTPMSTSGVVDFATARLKGDWVARVTVLREPV